MINKNFLLRCIAVSLFSILPITCAIAEEQATVDLEDMQSESKIYGKVFWNGAYVGSKKFDDLVVKKDGVVSTAADSGVFFPENYKLSWMGGGAAAGYYYGNIGVELEFLANKIEPKDSIEDIKGATEQSILYLYNFNYMAGLLNAYYHIVLNDMVSPYVGGGIGMARFHTSGKDLKGNKIESKANTYPLIAQAKVGASFNIENFPVKPYVNYRLSYIFKKQLELDTVQTAAEGSGDPDVKLNITVKPTYLLHNLEVGVLVPFAI